MKKIDDLSSKMSIPIAEVELAQPFMTETMGQQMGGLSMFSNKFKRGYGDEVFGSDENGMWLGKAEYAGAPFRVNMRGQIYSGSVDGYAGIFIDGANLRITMVDEDGDTRLLIGDDGL